MDRNSPTARIGVEPRAPYAPHDATTRAVIGNDGMLPSIFAGPLPRVPGYDVLRLLGSGGMGVVYEARDVRLKRAAAIKMILPTALHDADGEGLTLFRQEAEAVARLQHPGIVGIHEIGETRGVPYLVLEYVAGPNLADLLRSGPLAPTAAAACVARLADAIQHAHAAGIVHRDLKPANVLLPTEFAVCLRGGARSSTGDRSPGPKITDFGLAKERGDTSDRAHSSSPASTS